jgi:ArsR family transcriptional regulator
MNKQMFICEINHEAMKMEWKFMDVLPDELLEIVAQRFAALADVNRLRILQRLRAGGATVSQLCEELGLSQPNMSAHLAVLRNAALVVATRQGKHVVYSLADETAPSLCEVVCSSLREHQKRFSALFDQSNQAGRPQKLRNSQIRTRIHDLKKEEISQ